MIHPIRPLLLAVMVLLAGSLSWAQSPNLKSTHSYGAGIPITGQYIVVFRSEVTQHEALAAQLVRQSGGQLLQTYGTAIKGFAARLPDAAVQALANNPNVQSIEVDRTVELNESLTSPAAIQSNATWGIDRVDQRDLPLTNTYNYEYSGTGVYAFIVDTGIWASHNEFVGRVAAGYTAIADGNGTTDCNGHGTHVSGTVGGSNWGIAKRVTLVPVRVLNCAGSGTNSGVIAGIDWVAKSKMRPAVANMSLGGSYSATLNSAVSGAVSKGVTFVVAAGNSNVDACNTSPASEKSAVTVGATDSTDGRAGFSNYGSCLDLFAPGVEITSAWMGGNTASNTISGTSMATPHVTGVAALLVASGITNPTDVAAALIRNSTSDKVVGAGTGSPNRLLFSLASQVPVSGKTVAISDLTGMGKKSGVNWVATATVTVNAFDGSNFGPGIAGVTVSGVFAPGGTAVCITGSTGACTLSSATLSRASTFSDFTVNSLMGSGLSYDSSKNAKSTVRVLAP